MSAQEAEAAETDSISQSMHSDARTMTDYGVLNSVEAQEMAEHEGIAGAYDVNKLITWKVFGVFDGTVFQSAVLWQETGILAVSYFVLFVGMATFRWPGFSHFVGKEETIRAFISMFSTLIGLLLSFYTALNLKRWWEMRMAVRQIEEGCKSLAMQVSQICNDDVLLPTINRYARASLFLIFAASQTEKGDEPPRIKALKGGFLTEEESDKLQQLNPHMTFVQAETLWVWLANVATQLHNQGLTKGPPHYCALLKAVAEGRSGITQIQTYLETPIPLGYVHLLCIMVKFHNVILTILMALSSVMLAGGEKGFQAVGVFRTSFRAFFMPFLYNAILILNQNVTDPFGGDSSDFAFVNFDVNLMMSAKSYAEAARTLPEWIEKADFKAAKDGKPGAGP